MNYQKKFFYTIMQSGYNTYKWVYYNKYRPGEITTTTYSIQDQNVLQYEFGFSNVQNYRITMTPEEFEDENNGIYFDIDDTEQTLDCEELQP